MPTSPTRAAQRSPSHCMRPRRWSANTRGMRSRSLSSSIVNRGQSRENEQHAPQLRQSTVVSGSFAAIPSMPLLKFVILFGDAISHSAERPLRPAVDRGVGRRRDVDHIGGLRSKLRALSPQSLRGTRRRGRPGRNADLWQMTGSWTLRRTSPKFNAPFRSGT
jgi:hypothetical protein